jgi:hypothetical protein
MYGNDVCIFSKTEIDKLHNTYEAAIRIVADDNASSLDQLLKAMDLFDFEALMARSQLSTLCQLRSFPANSIQFNIIATTLKQRSHGAFACPEDTHKFLAAIRQILHEATISIYDCADQQAVIKTLIDARKLPVPPEETAILTKWRAEAKVWIASMDFTDLAREWVEMADLPEVRDNLAAVLEEVAKKRRGVEAPPQAKPS